MTGPLSPGSPSAGLPPRLDGDRQASGPCGAGDHRIHGAGYAHWSSPSLSGIAFNDPGDRAETHLFAPVRGASAYSSRAVDDGVSCLPCACRDLG